MINLKKNLCLIQALISLNILCVSPFQEFLTDLKKKEKKRKAALISNTMFCLPWRIKVSVWRTFFFISFSYKTKQTSWNIWELSQFPSNLGSLPTHDIPLSSLLWRHLEITFIFFHFLIWSYVSYWNSHFDLGAPRYCDPGLATLILWVLISILAKWTER